MLLRDDPKLVAPRCGLHTRRHSDVRRVAFSRRQSAISTRLKADS